MTLYDSQVLWVKCDICLITFLRLLSKVIAKCFMYLFIPIAKKINKKSKSRWSKAVIRWQTRRNDLRTQWSNNKPNNRHILHENTRLSSNHDVTFIFYERDSNHRTGIAAQFHQPYPIYHSCFKTESRKCFLGIRSHAKQNEMLHPFKKLLILNCKEEPGLDWHDAIG